MGWLSTLSETYDNCNLLVGKADEMGNMLLPISFSTALAQLEIVIDTDGNFVRAERLSKEEQTTLIPVTEDSATRSSGISPMPLCDKLCYVAGDYDSQLQPDKKMHSYYEAYMRNLKNWTLFSSKIPTDITVIYSYLNKGRLIEDLKKYNRYEKPEDMVRFKVINKNDSSKELGVWEKQEIIDSFQKYYLSLKHQTGLCYITGKEEFITEKLSSKIRNSGDKAKLISSNDKSNFTFRGRFVNSDDAATIGYSGAQKAHNALRWLISKQGIRIDSEYFVCWSTNSIETPSIFDDTNELFGEENEEPYTSEMFADKVKAAVYGYKQKLETNERIIVMAVDTADGSNQGRLSITYYAEFFQSDFFENLKKWHTDCMWQHQYKKNNSSGEYINYIGAPSVNDMVLAAYGTEHGVSLKVDDKIRKKGIERLIPCVIQGKRFPKDLMRAAVKNASEPLRYSSYNFRKILSVTCSMIRKCQIDDRKEVYNMALKEDILDRDYLFGRLLAVLNEIESNVNYYSGTSNRQTNAIKFWSTFVRKPAKTFSVIRDKLNPYIEKMPSGTYYFYSEIIEDILDGLDKVNGFDNTPLKEDYLMGYYSQSAAFRDKRKNILDEKKEDFENE